MKKLIATMPERKKRVEDLLRDLDDCEIVDAVIGKHLDLELLELLGIYDPEFRKEKGLRQMTPGEVGCMLSHYKMWLTVIERGYEEVICLEDDVSPSTENWEDRLAELLVDVEWDMVHLHSNRLDNNPNNLERRKIKRGLYTAHKEGGGTLGVAYSRRAIEWLVDKSKPVRRPSDGITNWPSSPHAAGQLKVFVTVPYLVDVDESCRSTIGGRMNGPPGEARFTQNFCRPLDGTMDE
jgi:GR25 family glycosyltransferase involved in LPS biosynthesis